MLRARYGDAVTTANGGPNVAVGPSTQIMIDRTGPTFVSGFMIGTNYDSAAAQEILDWSAAEDPNLPDSSEGSQVGSYEYRYRVNGGAWTAFTSTADITANIGARPGDAVDAEVRAIDTVGNVGPTMPGSTVASATCDTPTDIGFLSACNNEQVSDDVSDEPPVDLVEDQIRADGARQYRIAAPSSGWATIRNVPNSLTIGNAHDGWLFDQTRGDYDDNAVHGWRPGLVRGDPLSCGWIELRRESGNGDKIVPNSCPSTYFVSQKTISDGYNCYLCNKGSLIKLIKPVHEYANVFPNPAVGRPLTNDPNYSGNRSAGSIRYVSQAQIDAGYYVRWRYVTKPVKGRENYVLVRDVGSDKDNQRPNNGGVWVFIRRSALRAKLCADTNIPAMKNCGDNVTSQTG